MAKNLKEAICLLLVVTTLPFVCLGQDDEETSSASPMVQPRGIGLAMTTRPGVMMKTTTNSPLTPLFPLRPDGISPRVQLEGEMQYLRETLESYFATPRHLIVNPPGHTRAKDFIMEQMKGEQLEVHVQEFASAVDHYGQNTSVTGVNVIGVMKGLHWNTTADKIYVVGAHYDTTAETDGVDSNGSGVAAMLALAKRLRAKVRDSDECVLHHSIIFAAFDLQLREHDPSSKAQTGSEAFVRDFLGPRVKEVAKEDFLAGAIILDSVMNWNDSSNTQILEDGFGELFPDLHASVEKSDHRGNFMLLVNEKKEADETLAAEVLKHWPSSTSVDDSGNSKIRAPIKQAIIDPRKPTSQAATSTLFHFIKQDHISFWNYYPKPEEHMHLPAILFTDTGIWRNKPSSCRSGQRSCDTQEFITVQKLQFLTKTIDTLEGFLWHGDCVTAPGGAAASFNGGVAHIMLGLASLIVAHLFARV